MAEVAKSQSIRALELVIATLFTTFVVWCPLLYIYIFYKIHILRIPMALYTAFKIFDPRVESGKSYLHKPLLNLKFWEYLVSYFPCTIDFEETLDSGSQYVFGYHPHGILSYGAQLIGGCGKLKMREKCNDIDIRPVALPIALRVPIFGDYLLALGTISCSRTSIRNALKERASVAIVVGGAQESLHGEPGKPELILDKRKGFVREAIMAGVSLCPVYVFGESQIYLRVSSPPGSLLYKVFRFIEHYCGFTTPLFYGRFLFIPFRTHVHLVSGRPISTEKDESPSKEKIDLYHKKYKEELIRIYEKYKDKYEPYPHQSLKFAE